MTEELLPSTFCGACLHDTFKILVRLDEDYRIGWYTMQGHCEKCNAPVKLPEPKEETYL